MAGSFLSFRLQLISVLVLFVSLVVILPDVELAPESPLSAAQANVRFARQFVLSVLPIVLPFPIRELLSPELRALDHVFAHAQESNVSDVIATLDRHGWAGWWMMSIGDQKGGIMDETLDAALDAHDRHAARDTPFVAVELGTYAGYGALHIARSLQRFDPTAKRTHFISVDPSAMAHSIAGAMLEYAGVRPHVRLAKKFSGDVFDELKAKGQKIDFMLIDHVKHLYLSDLKRVLELDLLIPGKSVVVGIINPVL